MPMIAMTISNSINVKPQRRKPLIVYMISPDWKHMSHHYGASLSVVVVGERILQRFQKEAASVQSQGDESQVSM